jgi:hypothetical protein
MAASISRLWGIAMRSHILTIYSAAGLVIVWRCALLEVRICIRRGAINDYMAVFGIDDCYIFMR